jgi:signal transduction histidine kinase
MLCSIMGRLTGRQARLLGIAVVGLAFAFVLTLLLRYPDHPYLTNPRAVWGQMLFVLIYMLVALFVFNKSPRQDASAALLISACGAWVTNTAGNSPVDLAALAPDSADWLPLIVRPAASVISYTGILHFVLVLPAPPKGLRNSTLRLCVLTTLLYVVEAGALALAIYLSWRPDLGAWVRDWPRLWNIGYLITLLGAIITSVIKYNREYEEQERWQLRWFISGGVTIVLLNILLTRLPFVMNSPELLDANGRALLDALFPLLVGLVIVSRRVYGIEFFFNRALLYATLTALAALVYVLAISALQSLLPLPSQIWDFMALLTIALMLQPARQIVQRFIDRLLYGARHEPIRVFTLMGKRLESAPQPNQMISAIAETVGDSLKLPYVCVAQEQHERWQVLADYARKPDNRPSPEALQTLLAAPVNSTTPWARWDISFQGTGLGSLLVSARSPGERLTKDERNLLGALAQPIGAAIYAMQLTADLRHSRQQILETREEERRRIGRDLHDGLGPTMASFVLELGAARNLIAQHPQDATAVLTELQPRLTAAVEEIRRLVHDLRPPALDTIGLVQAISQQANRIQDSMPRSQARELRIDVIAAEQLPPLAAAVETAAYHIAREAMTNVIRHAHATQCTVALHVQQAGSDGNAAQSGATLVVDVTDNGVGMSAAAAEAPGVGLDSMRKRAQELDGTFEVMQVEPNGAHIRAALPL